MAIAVLEKYDSPRIETEGQGRTELRYIVSGVSIYDLSTTGPAEAMAAAWNQAPTSVDVYGNGSLIHHRNSIGECRKSNETTYHVSVVYKSVNWRNTGVARMRGSMGGGTQHILKSLATRRYGTAAVDEHLAIEPDSDGGIKGCDIPAGGMRFSLDQELTDADVTTTLMAMLGDMIPSTNLTPWRGFAARALCLLGVDFDRVSTGVWYFTFHFEAQPIRVNENVLLYIPPAVEGGAWTEETVQVTYSGWEHLWYKRKDKVFKDGFYPCVVHLPIALHIEQVMWETEFDNLPIEA